MDIAGAGINTYRIPTQQPYDFNKANNVGNGADNGAFNDGLDFEKNLQNVEGLTEQYYHDVAALKSYMADVHTNLGIDVRVPDLSKPESIKLNQIYQKALANIMHIGNMLHTGQVERQSHIQMGDVYNRSSRGKADSTLQQGVDFHNKALDPAIVEINNLTQQPSYDDLAYQQKYKVYEDMKSRLEQTMKAHPEEAETIQYQLDGLTPPARAIKQFAPQRSAYQERLAGRKTKAAGNMLKEIANLQEGTADDYKISKTTTNPNKPENSLMVRPNFQDATYNGKKIKEWGHDPQTNETFIFFDDGSNEDVSNQNPMSLARVMLGSNKGTFGIDTEYLEQWADENNVVNDDGTINKQALLRKGASEVKKQNLALYKKDITNTQLKNLGDYLSKIQEGTSYLLGTRSKGEVKTNVSPNPALIKKAKGSGKLYISNFGEIFAKPSDKRLIPQWARLANLYGPDSDGVDANDMKKFLQKYGAHLYLDKATNEGGEELNKKAQDLINKYSAPAQK